MPRQSRSSIAPRITVEPTFEADWPGASALATECVLNFGAVYSAVTTKMQRWVRAAGFPSLAGFNVATILQGAEEPLAPTEISRRMVVTPGTMTVLLASLQRRGLIRRVPHATDRRMALVELTEEGRRRVLVFRPRLHRAERQLMDHLSRSQQRTLLEFLAILQAAADEDITL